MRKRVILLLVAGLVAALAPCRAFADDPAPANEPEPAAGPPWVPPDPWATFVYEKPVPVYRLRLAIEELSMTVMSLTGYLIWDPPPATPGVPATTILAKLTFAPDSWYLDADSISTNFGGHVAAGTFYYMFARANRVSVPEAFLWTLGTSTVWELIEFKEPVSINDMIVAGLRARHRRGVHPALGMVRSQGGQRALEGARLALRPDEEVSGIERQIS